MRARRFGLGLAALALGVTAATGLSGATLAQAAPCPPGTTVPYPPGSCTVGSEPENADGAPAGTPASPGPGNSVAAAEAGSGHNVTVSSGSDTFTPGGEVKVGVQSVYTEIATTTATASGAARGTFTLPASLDDGNHTIVFSGLKDGNAVTVRLPFVLDRPALAAAAAAAAAAGGGGTTLPLVDALPRTGSAVAIPIAVSGLVLVLGGAGLVVVARRRRTVMDAVPGHLN